jgi:5-methylcytosine-specific restriction protein A
MLLYSTIKMNDHHPNKKNRYRENRGFIDPKTLPINDLGYRCCRYCSGSILPPKRTFCSANCVHEYRLRSSGTYLRRQVYLRDRGICAICKIDTKELAKQLSVLSLSDPTRDLLLLQNNINKTRVRKIKLRKNGGGLWDADHIVCVKDGGGECGLENIRTLCIKCHKLKTFAVSPKKTDSSDRAKFVIKLKNKNID